MWRLLRWLLMKAIILILLLCCSCKTYHGVCHDDLKTVAKNKEVITNRSHLFLFLSSV